MQIYDRFSNSAIPKTRMVSYSIFKQEQKTNIQKYILQLLEIHRDGLTCFEIADIGNIRVQSLTNPLQTLVQSKRLFISGIRLNQDSNRNVQVYRLNSNAI